MQIMAITATIMDTDGQSLLRLMAWLSPAFPVGGFAYSGGLERAVHDGLVTDAGNLHAWLETLLENGTWWNDAVLMAEAWHAHDDAQRLANAVELASALAGSAERHLEVTTQGEAFIAAAGAWPHPVLASLDGELPYAVAIGAVAAAHGVALERTVAAFLHALASQAVSAAIRLGVLGQRQGVGTIAQLETTILDVATKATRSTLDDLGSAAVIGDLSAIRHETQHSRLFRS
jgi:urease accessory protein